MIPASGLHADPLHPLAGDAYWHHESNFIFPATLAGFARVGAPQDLDGSSTVVAYYALSHSATWMRVVAHYARGAGDDRLVIVVDVFPIADGPSTTAAADEAKATFVKTIEHSGWRVVVRTMLSDAGMAGDVDAFARALPVDRLGAVDTRCPNAGCGT